MNDNLKIRLKLRTLVLKYVIYKYNIVWCVKYRYPVLTYEIERRLFEILYKINERMIVVEKAYKFRRYPNKQQEELINKTFGCCRFVYNRYLAKRIELYENNKKLILISNVVLI